MKPLKKPLDRDTYFNLITLSILTILILTPFINKPFHIDDALFIASAKHILKAPFNPYGFEINWVGSPQSMWNATANPPLNSYILAGAIGVFGESEISLHIVYLVFAIVAVLSFYFITTRFTSVPMLATLFFLSTPVFLISATNVMADIPLLAFMFVAIFFAIKGIDDQRKGMILVSSLFTTLATFTKYIGFVALPLIVVYWIAKKRKLNRELFLYLLLPILSLIAWHFYSQISSGQSHIFYSAKWKYAISMQDNEEYLTNYIQQFVITMIFIGGCIVTSVLLAPAFLRKFNLFTKLIVLLFTFIAYIYIKSELSEPVLELYALILSIGGFVLTFQFFLRFFSQKSIEEVFIMIWFVGIIVFIVFINWTVSGRVILLLLPPVIILLFQKLDLTCKHSKTLMTILCLISFSFSILIAAVDFGYSKTYKRAAEDIANFHNDLKEENQLWFVGHWGFQYYMEREGFVHIDLSKVGKQLKAGDYVVLPLHSPNAPMELFAGRGIKSVVKTFTYSNPFKIYTMNLTEKAGFYSNRVGILPFNIGSAPYDEFIMFEIS